MNGSELHRESYLETALQQTDAQSVERAAHRIKSNSATLGATELVELAQQTENLAAENKLDTIPDSLEKIKQEYERVMPAINKLLEALSRD